MNDIVSIRKIRPWPRAGVDVVLTWGDDFFLGGNWASLAAREIFTTEVTEEHKGNCNYRNQFEYSIVKEFPRVPQ